MGLLPADGGLDVRRGLEWVLVDGVEPWFTKAKPHSPNGRWMKALSLCAVRWREDDTRREGRTRSHFSALIWMLFRTVSQALATSLR